MREKVISHWKEFNVLIKVLLIAMVALVISPVVTPYMSLATVSYGILTLGYGYRKTDRKIHGILMGAGVVGDLALVLILEFQRHAIDTAFSFKLNFLQQSHIACSTVATVLYFPLMAFGLLMFKKPEWRPKLAGIHGKMGSVAFLFRSLGFLLMFSMLTKSN